MNNKNCLEIKKKGKKKRKERDRRKGGGSRWQRGGGGLEFGKGEVGLRGFRGGGVFFLGERNEEKVERFQFYLTIIDGHIDILATTY